jgi:hypothetical protein
MATSRTSAESNALTAVTSFYVHGVQVSASAPMYVRDLVRLAVALGAEPRPAGVSDVEYRTYLIRKVRSIMVALQLSKSEDLFQVTKTYVLAQHEMR